MKIEVIDIGSWMHWSVCSGPMTKVEKIYEKLSRELFFKNPGIQLCPSLFEVCFLFVLSLGDHVPLIFGDSLIKSNNIGAV